MSREIIGILANYSREKNFPIMIIASRNQVDYDSGYVCTSQELTSLVKDYNSPNLLICRDHCGPFFCDLDRGLSVEQCIDQCKKTIKEDIASGFDLIHIDVSRIPDKQLEYGRELIEYCLELNPNIMLEFGSEDNTGIDINSSIGRIEEQLEFLQQFKKNVKFFVTQTGSLTKSSQAGEFSIENNYKIAKQIHDAGFLFKEHNADYFTQKNLLDRKQAGIDSLNIAPQLGTIQTAILKKFAPNDLWERFAEVVYRADKWQRWVIDPANTSKDQAVDVSAHYCFNTQECKEIILNIDEVGFKQALTDKITYLLDEYRIFTNEQI